MAGWKIVSCPFDLSGKRIYRKSRAPISLPARILENRGGNNDSRAPSSPPPPTTRIKYSSPPETVPCSCLHKWPKFASLTVIIRIFWRNTIYSEARDERSRLNTNERTKENGGRGMRRGDTTISRPREIRRPDQGFRIPRANFDDVRQKFRGEPREESWRMREAFSLKEIIEGRFSRGVKTTRRSWKISQARERNEESFAVLLTMFALSRRTEQHNSNLTVRVGREITPSISIFFAVH